MVLGKRTREHSSDTNSGCFEILLNDKPTTSSSPLGMMMQEDDVSGVEAMLRRRKQPKNTPVSSSSSNKMAWTKDDELIILGSIVDYEKETKLSHRSDWDAFYGYVKDFIEAEFSKKQLIDKIRNLNKRFLGNKARCGDEEEGPYFTSTEDDEIFKLSMIIWDTREETECGSAENVDQAKDVTCVDHGRVDENMDQAKVDVPCVEHEPVNENMDQAKDATSVDQEQVDVDENMEQEKVLELNNDAPCVEHERVYADTDQEMDVPCVEHELVNNNMDQEEVERAVPCVEVEQVGNLSIMTDKEKSKEDGVAEFCALKDALTDIEEKEKSEEEGVNEVCALKNALANKENNEEDGMDEFCAMKDALTDKEKSEEDGGDEYCALKDALEATTFFQSIGKYQQKVMLQNLKNLRGARRKELADELKELIDEEMKLCAKKLSLTAKLASAWEESC